jgi:hypothetical protein
MPLGIEVDGRTKAAVEAFGPSSRRDGGLSRL